MYDTYLLTYHHYYYHFQFLFNWSFFLQKISSYIHLLIITMSERIMYNERHAEYIKQENEQQMILVTNVNTIIYTTYVQ